MGCCTSSAGIDDDAPPAELSPQVEKLFHDLDSISSASGTTAGEPSRCAWSLRLHAIVLHAQVAHGITGTMDTSPDGKVYEAIEVPELRPKVRKRILDWMKHVKLPRRREGRPDAVTATSDASGASTWSCSVLSEDSEDYSSERVSHRHNNGLPSFPEVQSDAPGRPPRSGDLPTTSSERLAVGWE